MAVAALMGLLGGAAAVMVMRMTTRGWWVLVPYALMVVVLALYFRQADIRSFRRRFALAFETYFFATAVAYVYASIVNHRTVAANLRQQAGHALLLLGIGGLGCLMLAAIGERVRAES
jgi:hypothetical protein